MKLQENKEHKGKGIPTLKTGAETRNLYFFFGFGPVAGQNVGAIVKQNRFCGAPLFPGKGKSVLSAVFLIGTAQ
jgi:hypothetical protein